MSEQSGAKEIDSAPKQDRTTRRKFGKEVGATVAATALSQVFPIPSAFGAEEDGTNKYVPPPRVVDPDRFVIEENPQSEPPEMDWDALYAIIDEVKASEAGTQYARDLEQIKSQLTSWQEALTPRTERINTLINLMNNDTDSQGRPKLLSYYQQLLGKMETKKPEDLVPFLFEKKYMQSSFGTVSQAIFSIKDRLWGNNPDANIITDKKPPIEPDPSSKSDPLPLPPYYGFQLNTLENHIKTLATQEQERQQEHQLESGRSTVTLHIDPNLEVSEKGQAIFEEHKAKIDKFIGKFPYFRKMFTRIVLTSSKYGDPKDKEKRFSHGGSFSSVKDNGKYVGQVTINMDSSDENVEVVFAHEAFGHGTDVDMDNISKSLAAYLSPEDYYKRLIYEHEVLNNPDWGDNDSTIPQLFREFQFQTNPSPNDRSSIGTEHFMSTITDYPRNCLLQNELFWNNDPKRSIIDQVLGNPDPSQPESQTGSRIDTNKLYTTMDDFLKDYMPVLEKDAQAGNIRSKVILSGLRRFQDDFKNRSFLWQPWVTNEKGDLETTMPGPRGGIGTKWSNYCNSVVSNATLYHAFINGEDEIRLLFNPAQRKRIEDRALELRRAYRRELFAEGTAHDYFYGDRMKHASPYRDSLKQIAHMLDQRILP